MSWLISDAVASIREQLQDTRAGSYRYSDVKLLRYLNSAFSDVRRLRPDLLLPTLDVPAFVEADLLTPTAFPIDGMYYSAIVDYVAGTVSLEEDEFSVDGRASTLLNRFTQKLISRGA